MLNFVGESTVLKLVAIINVQILLPTNLIRKGLKTVNIQSVIVAFSSCYGGLFNHSTLGFSSHSSKQRKVVRSG